MSRGLYSLVDWNDYWNHIKSFWYCRGLYSLVDWNPFIDKKSSCHIVSRLIQPRGLKFKTSLFINNIIGSRLIQPRGLKYPVHSTICHSLKSRLIQPRGLKYGIMISEKRGSLGRGLYSLVDWNHQGSTYLQYTPGRGLYSLVDWNIVRFMVQCYNPSRGLYSLVDWNMDAWTVFNNLTVSRLIQPRGLKFPSVLQPGPEGQSRLIQPRGLKS